MTSLRVLLEALTFAIFLRPSLYWVPNSLPFLKLGVTEFDPEFSVRRPVPLCMTLFAEQLERLQAMNVVRQRNAGRLRQILESMPQFDVPRLAEGNHPNYVRLPVLAADRATRDRAVAALVAQGIGATAFYPGGLCDIPGIEKHLAPDAGHCKGAEEIAERLFTLPTHAYVEDRDLKSMAAILERV